VSVASTLSVFDNIVRISENPDFLDLPVFQSAYTKEQIKDQKIIARKRYISMGWNNWFKTALFYSMSNIKILHDSGVEIALGTDRAAGPLTHRELELIVEAGIPALQAIKIGTLNAAKYLSIEKKLGSIEEGKLADMVILNENPVEDIKNISKIYLVIKNGDIVDRNKLKIPINAKNFSEQ